MKKKTKDYTTVEALPYHSQERAEAESIIGHAIAHSSDFVVAFEKDLRSIGFKDFKDFDATKAAMPPGEFLQLIRDLKAIRDAQS